MNIKVYLKFWKQILGLDFSFYYVYKFNVICFIGNVYSLEIRIYIDVVELKEMYISFGILEINMILIKEELE